MRLPGCQTAISVVMPTYERKASLARALHAIGLQVYPRHLVEVLVVCDGGDDGSAEMASGMRLPFETRVLWQNNAGPAAARNAALAQARGELIVFLDDDVIAHPYNLAEHAAAHDGASDLVVIGPLLPPLESRSPWVRWEHRTVVRQYADMEAGAYRPGPRQFYTGNASVRLEHLVGAGGFNVNFRRGEDVELAFRLQARGLRFVFQRRAAAIHIADRSLRFWLRAAREYGRNDMIVGHSGGRPDMIGAVAREFHERHWLNRALVRWSIRTPRLQAGVARSMAELSRAAQAVGGDRPSLSLCGAAFGLEYWRGVADGLGGPAAAAALIERGARPRKEAVQ